ncbi:MAG TPA: glycosyltransferase [Rhodanobacteraceae bacterium]|nr:glycosyltransferase [Rhodanobacteraceae bacterium]
MNDHPATPTAPALICLLGPAEPRWRASLLAGLPAASEVIELVSTRVTAALDELAAQYPGRDAILIEAGTRLPPHWHPRLSAALTPEGVLAVAALTTAQLPGIAAPADDDALARLDAACYGYGTRAAPDARHLDTPLLAVRAAASTCLPRDAAGFDLAAVPAPWRVLQLEDLLVARPHGDPVTGAVSAHPALIAALAHAAVDAAPGWPGLDGKPVLLHVLHGWGGGATRWVTDYARADLDHHHLLLLADGHFRQRRHGERWRLVWADGRADDTALRQCHPAAPIASTAISHAGYGEFLARIVRDYGVDHVLISSLIGHSLDALRSGLPTTRVIHDHYPLWPVLHRDFGDSALAFDAAQLTADLAATAADHEFLERSPAHWQALREAFVTAVLGADARLVAPSPSALTAELRLAPEFKRLPQHVIPHGLAPWPTPIVATTPPPRQRLRLLVPGRVRRGKGAELLRAALPALRQHAELVLLGAGADGMDFFAERDVHVVLDYRRDDLPGLIHTLAPDAALILPTVAETFGYTLSEMWRLGVPVIATRVGALAERIDDGVDGWLVAPTADSVCARVAALAADRHALTAVRSHLSAHTARDTAAMATDWNACLALAAPCAPRYHAAQSDNRDAALRHATAELHRVHDTLATREAELAEQRAEIDRRGDWGWQLDRERQQAVARGAALDAELIERTRWAQSLDAEINRLAPLVAHREEMLGSRSWRITRPLRSATTRLRQWRGSLAFRLARLKSLRGRLRGSLGRRGLLGTLKRIGQEFEHRQPATSPWQVPQPGSVTPPAALPTSATPRVSIVIPVYGKFEYTAACLAALAEHAAATPFEVIVVDDASPDDSAGHIARIAGVRLLRNPENLGFVGSCNRGAAAAQGEFVLFLNNDTVVTAGWLEALLACFAERPDAGLVGARLVYPDGRLQEAGGIVFNDASGWNYGRFENPDDPRFNFRREADYCSGAAIVLRRALFEQLGGFDQRYAPAYYEDTDLAFQVRAQGLKVYVEPAATVVHFEGISAGTDTASGMKRYQAVNQGKFRDKWRAELARQPAPIQNAAQAHLAATHRARKRVLIVDASTPTPDQDSGSLRLINIMRLLRDMGCQVSFLPDNLARFDKYTPLLQAEGIEALYHPFVADMPSFYRQRGHEFDLIMVSRHYIAAHHLGLIRSHAPRARFAFDTVDLHYLRERRAAELDPRPELARQAETTRAQELKLIRAADVTLVVSEIERTLLATDAPGARVEVLSNVHEIRGRHGDYASRKNLLFVGGFQHPPNIDAMQWFCAEVLPLIRRELPQVTLDIVGSKITPAVSALASAAVTVHGFVEDLLPMLDAARISVAPLRYGAGVKGKVNSAMSHGLPVVATPMAVEGIHAVDGEDVLVGTDAASFAAKVVALYRDPALWLRLSDNGIDNVRRQFSFDQARTTLQDLLA